MSTVPPSPPWPTTRTSWRPLACIAAAMPVATAGALPNSECIQGICHDVSGYGVENTSRQPVAFTATSLPVRRPHRGVERISRAERLAAALAGTVAAVERVRAAGSDWTERWSGLEQPVADREAADLVVLHRLVASVPLTDPAEATAPRSRSMFSAVGPGAAGRCGPRQLAVH